MVEVTLRRCTIRVVRRGGWSWGREPRELVNDVMRALPALLAAELERTLPADADGEISAPLRIDLGATLRELRDWARSEAMSEAAGAGSLGPAAGGELPPVPHAIGAALQRALQAARIVERINVPEPAARSRHPAAREPEPQERATILLTQLEAWRAAGALESMLRGLPDALVLAWHRVLFEDVPAASLASSVASSMADASVIEWLVRRSVDAPALESMRLRLHAAALVAAAAPASRSPGAIRAWVESSIRVKADAGARRVATQTPLAASVVRAAPGYEARVSHALPFLLLGPLHRIGWLDVLHTTLAGAKLEQSLPILASALATRVLPEPERGWRRSPAALQAAAMFAGDAEPRPDDELVSLARVAAPLMPAMDAVIRRSLLDGRARGDTLLVTAVAGWHLVVDPPGVFLVAHAAQADALAAPALEANAPLFIPESDADSELLAALDTAGVTFVTPARPVRGERWMAIPGTRAPRLYSNRPVQRIVPPPDDLASCARETWRAFEDRPLPGRPAERAFDRSLSLAASLALGTIAWELWRTRESTDALLALGRFGDIDATVRFDEHRVRVRLPLGRRYRDLKDAGLLEDVPRVPWLDYRTLVFAGG